MTKLEQASREALNEFDKVADAAFEEFVFASKYGTKAETQLAKQAWKQATAIVLAVDTALQEVREKVSKTKA